jgi:hypothetical protein
MISEFESFLWLVYPALLVLMFSYHEKVIDIHRDKDTSIVSVERPLIRLTLRKTEIQNELAKDHEPYPLGLLQAVKRLEKKENVMRIPEIRKTGWLSDVDAEVCYPVLESVAKGPHARQPHRDGVNAHRLRRVI